MASPAAAQGVFYTLLRVQSRKYIQFSWPYYRLEGGTGFHFLVGVPESQVEKFGAWLKYNHQCTHSDASYMLQPSPVLALNFKPQIVLTDDPKYTYKIVAKTPDE